MFTNRFLLLVLLTSNCFFSVFAESPVRIWEEKVEMPTYRLEAADKNPMFYKHESYQGAQKKIYPYPFLEQVTNIREDKPHKFLFLENEYTKLAIAPDIGGRLYFATDKTNGYDIFYHNHVVKPALIGMLGAWISGGIEWCVFHHHRNTTHMPVDYTLAKNQDGSATIWFGETERRHRMKWLIGVTLSPGSSAIKTTVKMFNRTPLPHSMLYWANVAVHVNENYQVLFPSSVNTATYHAKNDFVHWPIGKGRYQGVDYTGVDLSWWKNHPEPVSFFAWDLQEDFMGGYDHGQNAGLVHVGNHHVVCSAKLWEWGPGPRGAMWDTKILTDSDGPYAELMVGAFSDNQPDYSWIQPGEVRTFSQTWYPVRDIGGFRYANERGAVNLTLDDGILKIGLNTTTDYENAQIVLQANERILYEETVTIGPASPVIRTVKVPRTINETNLICSLFSKKGAELIRYQPRDRVEAEDLPPEVEPPPPPSEIVSNEDLFFTGLRIQQIHNPRIDPDAYFLEAIRRDSLDSRCNTMMGVNKVKQGLYAESERMLKRALIRPRAEYTRPGNAEAHFYLGLAQRALGKTAAAEDNLYRASWDFAFHAAAHEQLAELSCLGGDHVQALDHINRALRHNTINTRLRNIRSTLFRKLGLLEDAESSARAVIAFDPLDFWARNELALILLGQGKTNEAIEVSGRLVKRMREDVQNYLELASDYGSLGLWEEAIDVLWRPVERNTDFAATYPMLHYYLGYYALRKGDQKTAERYFRAAAQMPADYCFPFRLESETVLKAAISANSKDAMALYYLGNLLYEKRPAEAIRAWESARELAPGFAITHRNLGWAYARIRNDVDMAIEAYEKAVENNPNDPRLFSELDELYEKGNTDPEKRLAMLKKHHPVVVKLNNSFLREIMVQVLSGHYDTAIRYLDENFFHIREGGGEIHNVFVDAHLLRGLDRLKSGDARGALDDFVRAAEYPENLSVGLPRRDRKAPKIAYFTGLAHGKLGNSKQANTFFEKATGQDVRGRGTETDFYRAMALRRLGNTAEAARIFETIRVRGERQLGTTSETDFFAKFGEQQTEDAQKSDAWFLFGLGQMGLGANGEASTAFEKAAALNLSHRGVKVAVRLMRL